MPALPGSDSTWPGKLPISPALIATGREKNILANPEVARIRIDPDG